MDSVPVCRPQRLYVCMYVCMYVCSDLLRYGRGGRGYGQCTCLYVCMYVCMYVRTC